MTLLQKVLFNDCYSSLVRMNEHAIHSATEVNGEFMYGRFAELIFSIGEDLSLTYEIRFIALELFNKFMRQHLTQLEDNFDRAVQRRLANQPPNLAEEIRTQVSHEFSELLGKQVTLRMISCLQIASKTVMTSSAVTPVHAKAILGKMKLNFSLKAILHSEIRVLSTLNFSVTIVTPYNFIELICEFLANKFETASEAEDLVRGRLFEMSCNLLQYFYTIRPLFYLELYRQVTKNENVHPEDKIFIARISSDNLLLAAGILAMSSYLIWDGRICLEIIQQLCTMTSLSEEDISDVFAVFGKILARPDAEAIVQNAHSSLAGLS